MGLDLGDFYDGWQELESLTDIMITDVDELCKEMLNESSPILLKSVKNELSKSIIHEGDSELVESFRVTNAEKCKNGAYIVSVWPYGNSATKTYKIPRKYAVIGGSVVVHGKRKFPVSNLLKAVWKEYGIPGKQPASPFLSSATRKAEEAVASKMQEVYNRRTGIT